MVASPALYRLAANRDYDAIPARVASNPEDICWTDHHGSSSLHLLCQVRTHPTDSTAFLRAVRAIVQVYPAAVAWPNVATLTPLYFAVEKRCLTSSSSSSSATTSRRTVLNQHQSTRRSILPPTPSSSSSSSNGSADSILETVKGHDRQRRRQKQSTATRLVLMLLEACPEAVSVRTKAGFRTRAPFHVACEANVDYIVLQTMLRINPALAVQPFTNSPNSGYYSSYNNSTEENPLQLLWKNYQVLFNSSNISNPDSSFYDCGIQDKMALLLQAAHTGTVDSTTIKSTQSYDTTTRTTSPSSTFYLLHAVCSVKCPRDYAAWVLQEYASQMAIRDSNGLLPVHHAVRATSTPEWYTQFIVTSLCEAYAQAATITDPHTGRLPLHEACARGWTWHKGGVQELALGGNPNALRTIDPLTRLVPFLQSAEHAINSRLHLSTTYELLLAAPEMVQPANARRVGATDDPKMVATEINNRTTTRRRSNPTAPGLINWKSMAILILAIVFAEAASPKTMTIGPFQLWKKSSPTAFRWTAQVNRTTGLTSSLETSTVPQHLPLFTEIVDTNQKTLLMGLAKQLFTNYASWLCQGRVTFGLLKVVLTTSGHTQLQDRLLGCTLLEFGKPKGRQISYKTSIRNNYQPVVEQTTICRWSLPITGGCLTLPSKKSSSGGEVRLTLKQTRATVHDKGEPQIQLQTEIIDYRPHIVGASLPSNPWRTGLYLGTQSLVHGFVMWRFHLACRSLYHVNDDKE